MIYKLIQILLICFFISACQSPRPYTVDFHYRFYNKERKMVSQYLQQNNPYAKKLLNSSVPKTVEIGIDKCDINNDGYQDIIAIAKHHTYFCNETGCPVYIFMYDPNDKTLYDIEFAETRYLNTYGKIIIQPTLHEGLRNITVANKNAEQAIWCWHKNKYQNCTIKRKGFQHTDPPLQENIY